MFVRSRGVSLPLVWRVYVPAGTTWRQPETRAPVGGRTSWNGAGGARPGSRRDRSSNRRYACSPPLSGSVARGQIGRVANDSDIFREDSVEGPVRRSIIHPDDGVGRPSLPPNASRARSMTLASLKVWTWAKMRIGNDPRKDGLLRHTGLQRGVTTILTIFRILFSRQLRRIQEYRGVSGKAPENGCLEEVPDRQYRLLGDYCLQQPCLCRRSPRQSSCSVEPE
jgi:hypothetical protein